MISVRQQLTRISPLSIGLVLLFAAFMTYLLFKSFAATGPATLYTNPGGSKSVTKGQSFTVAIRISTNNNVPVTGASVYLSYPADKLQVVSQNYSGSSYTTQLAVSNSGGVLRMDRAAFPMISGGDKLFAQVTFKAVATGAASLTFTNSSVVTSGEDDSNLLSTKNGVTYNISNPSTPPPSGPSGGSSGGSTSTNSSSNSSFSSGGSGGNSSSNSSSSGETAPSGSEQGQSASSNPSEPSVSSSPGRKAVSKSKSVQAQQEEKAQSDAKKAKFNALVLLIPATLLLAAGVFLVLEKRGVVSFSSGDTPSSVIATSQHPVVAQQPTITATPHSNAKTDSHIPYHYEPPGTVFTPTNPSTTTTKTKVP